MNVAKTLSETHQKATILLIDDHPMLRNGVKQLINTSPDLCVIGEASSGEQGIKMAEKLDPDLILLDINMPELNGLETLKLLRQKALASRIIIFTISDDEDDIFTALKWGADNYLLKDMEPEALLVALHHALFGKIRISDAISDVILNKLRNQQKIDANNTERNIEILTQREKEVLGLVAQGYPNKLIARQLHITDSTVKVHVKNLLKKLNFKSRVEVAIWAQQAGISG